MESNRFSTSMVILIMVLLTNCTNLPPRKELKEENPEVLFGLDFNNQRKQVGLMPAMENGQCSIFVDLNTMTWKNPEFDTIKDIRPCYAGKIIYYVHDTITSEIDLFMSNKTHLDQFQRKVNEKLIYSYTFYPMADNDIGWDYYFFTEPNDTLYWVITRHEADSILHSWGLKYP